MYRVIGTVKSRAFRVLWMLEELGQPYEMLPVPPRSEEARSFNPLGKIPALVDGDEVLTDSVAIMTYLADKHGGLTALAGTAARASCHGSGAPRRCSCSVKQCSCSFSCIAIDMVQSETIKCNLSLDTSLIGSHPFWHYTR